MSGRHWVFRSQAGGVPTLAYSTRRKPPGGSTLAAAGYWVVVGSVVGLLAWLVLRP